MMMFLLLMIVLLIIVALFFLIRSYSVHLDIINGYVAKSMCSAVFVADRAEELMLKEDLASPIMNYAKSTVDYKDLSVSTTFFGLARCKAIYRPGLGATLIREFSEKQIREQNFNLSTPPDVNQDETPWPMGDNIDDIIFPSNINQKLLKEAVNSLFVEANPKELKITRAVVILYDGKLIAEQYAQGFSRKSKLLGWSMTKSIISALFGIALEENKINIDHSAPVPEWNKSSDDRHSITSKNLLQQTAGLNFNEDYSSKSDALQMLYVYGDMAKYAASRSLKDKPGSQFYYSSGNTNILSRIIRQTIGEKEYHSFPYRKLLYKLGMNNFIMEVDASGTFVGSSYSWGTARDWARFGLLYFNNGVFNNEQILSKDWIAQSIQSSNSSDGGKYGFQFWLNKPKNSDSSERRFQNAPEDMFYASGTHGQNVFIIPSKKLVIVRIGVTKVNHGDYGADEFFKLLFNSME